MTNSKYQIDVDRVHAVLNGELHGRGCGKTFAIICQLAGFIWTGEPVILCKITNYRDMNYISYMMASIFEELKLPLKRESAHDWRSLDSYIVFVTEEDWERRTQRYRDPLYINMRHWD